MKILLVEPYYTGSHKQWADGYKNHSMHEIRIISMEGQFWKWRMHSGAITLAKIFNKMRWKPDLILATDMIDLTTFLALTKQKSTGIPTAIYFHENQISYPWSPNDRDVRNKRDTHYGFINYASALAANKIFFNSKFHLKSFTDALLPFLNQFPDHQELDMIETIRSKSEVLYLGLDLHKFDNFKSSRLKEPLILWNHRWEYDKNPESFFKILEQIKNDGVNYKLAVLGENFSKSPTVFEKSKTTLKKNITHWGYTDSFDSYAKWIWKADILPVTSNQEFFGASVMEAIYCNTWPILPNRLSYPELIPDKNKNIYRNENELYEKVLWAIKNYKKIRKYNVRNIAVDFDWTNLVSKYDEAFDRI